MKSFDIAFIGAGASALMCASFIKGRSVAVIEASRSIAPKIKISGGGKCNFTNESVSEDNYLGDRRFIKRTFEKFGRSELLDFFHDHGLAYVLKEDGKYFCKNGSIDIIDIFSKLTKHCDIFLGNIVQEVSYDELFIIRTDKKEFKAKILVIASGGLSYKSLGASDIGFKIAESFGHNIINPAPALVGFTLQKEQFWMKDLSGISVPVHLKVSDKVFKNNLLFAHKGISGPSVLSGSLYWNKGSIVIDFLPLHRVSELLSKKSDKQISSILPLPKRFVKEYLKSLNMDDISINRLTKKDIIKLERLNGYEFSPAGNFGYTKAEVTKGGVNTDEIDFDTFESLKRKNIYFIGEVLNVTGELGGYNFQWAFSSAKVLSEHLNKTS